MKERPILFSGAMVRAILDGKKTQTRRIVRIDESPTVLGKDILRRQRGIPSNAKNVRFLGPYLKCEAPDGSNTVSNRVLCPYGVPGDRLWVRETFGTVKGNGIRTVYRADGDQPKELLTDRRVEGMKWTPSIFMRRCDSRITLEVTDVRVDRLQDISEGDACAEGVDGNAAIPALINGKPGEVHCFGPDAARKAFAILWDGVNGRRAAWLSNPWVWVVEFRRIEEQRGAA